MLVSDKEDGSLPTLETSASHDALDWQQTLFQPVIRVRKRIRSHSVSCKIELPRQGVVKFKSSDRPLIFYRRCSLYVEKGQAVITVLSCRKNVINIPLHTAYLVEHKENDKVFEIRTESGSFYLFKTTSDYDRLCWEVALSYAIRLGK